MISQRLAVSTKSHLRSVAAIRSTNRSRAMAIHLSVRSLATAQEKLQSVMEAYRKKNFTRELPSRFAKEVCKAADVDGDGYISVHEVEKLLKNIGASDKMTASEIEEVMDDIGTKEGPKGVPLLAVVDYVKKSTTPGS